MPFIRVFRCVGAKYQITRRNAVVVLDDVYRKDESSIAEAWSEQFPDFELDIEDSPYGTAVLRRTSA